MSVVLADPTVKNSHIHEIEGRLQPSALQIDDNKIDTNSFANEGEWELKTARPGAFFLLAPNDPFSRFLFKMIAQVEPCKSDETYTKLREVVYVLTKDHDSPGRSGQKIPRLVALFGLIIHKLASKSYFIKTDLQSVIWGTHSGFNMSARFNAYRRDRCEPNVEPQEDPKHFRFIDINSDTIPTINLLSHYILSTINALFKTPLEQKWGFTQSLSSDGSLKAVNSYNSFSEMKQHFDNQCGSRYKIIRYEESPADARIYHEGAKIKHFIFVGLNPQGVELGALQENNIWWVNQEKVDDHTLKQLSDDKVILQHYELPKFFEDQKLPGSQLASKLSKNISGRYLRGMLPMTFTSFYLAMHAAAFERQSLPEVEERVKIFQVNTQRIANGFKKMFEF